MSDESKPVLRHLEEARKHLVRRSERQANAIALAEQHITTQAEVLGQQTPPQEATSNG